MLIQVTFKYSPERQYTYHCRDDTDVKIGDTVLVPVYSGERHATVVALDSDYVKQVISVEPRPTWRTTVVGDRGYRTIQEWDTATDARRYMHGWLTSGDNYAELKCERL